MSEKEQIVEKLYADIKDLHLKLDRCQSDKAEAIGKYEDNEKYWKGKLGKLERESDQLFEMNRQLKEDNGDLLTQLDKFVKRIKQVEGEVRREQEMSAQKDGTI